MPFWSWLQRRGHGKRARQPRRPLHRRTTIPLRFEILENRTLPSGNTLLQADQQPLLLASNHATAAGYLAASQDVQLFRINSSAGDVVTVAANAASIGSGQVDDS